jgi:signal transduction histidine kinase
MARAWGFVLRRHPGVFLGALLAATVAVPPAIPMQLPAMVLLYGIAGYGSLRAAIAGVAAAAAAVAAHDLRWDDSIASGPLISTAALCALAVAVGWAQGLRRAAAARERELLAERAAAEERLRIARELHDAVGHDVSLMVVQAQALGATAGDERVREATDAIASLGRRTMGEMHRTLRALRGDDEAPAERLPQPGLAALDEVLDGARAAGVPLTVNVEGAPRPLGASLDASAFRIVQEAVTNVVRHAAGARATVTVRYGDEALELCVADEGGDGGSRSNGGGGHGLIGMRERAELFGGTLSAGRVDGSGFEVRAALPYESEPA